MPQALNRRRLLAATAGAAATVLTAQPRPRNILLLIADDLGLHTGAYGDPIAKTPHLDRLAREGVRFTHAFCTTPSCSASRSVILSGLHNHANGQYGHEHAEAHFSYLPHIVPTPRLLQAAGYRTGVIGKLHVGPPDRFGWDLAQVGADRRVYEMAQSARQFIEASGNKPWYLHIGYGDPHRLGRGFGNDASYTNVTKTPFDAAKVKVPSFLPDNGPAAAEVAQYYEAANRLDQGVGMMLRVLEETGQLDNTLVVFLSDNGMPFANAKTNLYDAGARLPLIVRAPDQRQRGLVNNAMVSWTDLLPTFLDYAGAQGPPYPLHGRSFLPILTRENPSGWDEVYFSHTFHEITMYYPVRGMRTRRYKYLRNLFPTLEFPHASDLWASQTWQSIRREGPTARLGGRPIANYLHRPEEELYDVTRDPDELTNLANHPEHQAALKELHQKVHAFRRRTKDPWTIINTYQGEEPGDSAAEREVTRTQRQQQ